jgi:hypothetical protein
MAGGLLGWMSHNCVLHVPVHIFVVTLTNSRAVSPHFLRRRMLESRRIFAKFKIGWELRNSGEFLCYV